MPNDDLCPRCGAGRPPDSPEGLCPECLLRLAWVSDLSAGPVEAVTNGGASLPPSPPGSRANGRGALDRLTETIGSIPRVLLRDTDVITGTGPVIRPTSSEMPDPADRAGRLQLLGEVARGGMGAILKGRDNDLGRDLAVKVLLERHGNNPEFLRRFVEEAQIAGQLQHPGIVPVYELGTFADRRPYFAMKLVKGRTLAEVMAERSDPASDRPRLLAIFLDVAQTMAYAHARGVIHRDLKPSNVMVGSFGEVQVMDWGLAKVLARGGAIEEANTGKLEVHETVIATARSGSGSNLSQAGSVLGTPSYMAPEQARGENDHLDERADVFALGSILCEILTGQPAFTGRSSAEILRQAARSDLSGAWKRLDACVADAELVTLARDALAPEAEDRPRDAGAIVDRLSGYLSGVQERVQAAERDRAVAVARAIEERRRHKVQLALAASILVFTMLGGLSTTYYLQQQQARRAQAERAVDRAIEDAVARYGRARGADSDLTLWGEARVAAIQAREQAVAANAPLEVLNRATVLVSEIEQIGRNRRLVAELLHIHASMGDRVDYEGNQDFVDGDQRYGQAFRDFGTDLSRLTPEEGADLLRKLGGEVKMELAAALDDWAYVRTTANRLSGRTRETRSIGGGKDDQGAHFELTKLLDPDPMRNRIRDAATRNDFATLAALAEEIDPAVHPAQTVNLLGVYLFKNRGQRGYKDMVRLLRKAQPHHSGDFQINHNLAFFLLQSNLHSEALPFCTAAIAVRPRSACAWRDLGDSYTGLKRDPEAIAAYRRLVELSPSAWPFLGRAASMLEKQGKTDQADAEYRKAAALAQKFPAPIVFVDDFAFAVLSRWEKLGLINEVLSGVRRSVAHDPAGPNPRLLLCQLLAQQHKTSEFLTELERLTSGYYRVPYGLGIDLSKSGQLVEAAAAYRKAIQLEPDYAEAYCNLGQVLQRQGDYAGALAMCRRGHELGIKQPGWRHPSSRWVAEAERMVALAERLPALLNGEDHPKDVPERLTLARMCYDTKQFVASDRFWAEALDADPKLGDDRRLQHRYDAACAAALASTGQGKDEPTPDDVAKAKLRGRALGWLKAELVAWAKVLDVGPAPMKAAIEPTLRHWKADADLANIRDIEGLAKLPDPERQEWQAFWADVDALVARTKGGPAKP